MSDRIEVIADRMATVALPDESLQAIERVRRSTDNQGNVRLEGRDFIPLRSPDGTVWRVRVRNDGTLYTAEAPLS